MATKPNAKTRSQAKTKTKKELILSLLSRRNGASTEQLIVATGWQAHSVRGYLSGTIKKILRFNLETTKSNDGTHRYYIQNAS